MQYSLLLTRTFVALSLLCALSASPLAAQTLLHTDAMQSGTGWQFSHFGGTDPPGAGDISSAQFGFNYAAIGIPEAPNSDAGDIATRGLRLGANLPGGFGGDQVAAVYEDAGFTGQYTLQVDVWLNWAADPGGSGTTEHAGVLAGFNVADAQSTFSPGQNGAGVLFSSDGDAGCGSSGICDFALVKDGAELDLGSGQYAESDFGTGNRAGYNETNSNANLDLQSLFPSFDIAAATGGLNGTGTQPAGALGFQWVTVTIEVDASAVGNGTGSALGTAKVTLESHQSGSSFTLGTIDNSARDDPFDGFNTEERPVGLEGGIGLMLTDYFGSPASDPSLAFALFDNVRVFDGLVSPSASSNLVSVPEPATIGLMLLFALAIARRWRRRVALVCVTSFAIAITVSSPAVAVLNLTGNFDHGSLDSWSGDLANIQLVGRENHPNTGGWRWLYFEASGVDAAQPVFNINQDFAGGNSALNTHEMVYSYDNENWSFFDNNLRSGNSFTFSNNSPFTSDQVYVAYAQPYSYGRSAAHTAAVLATPWAVPTVSGDANGVIGETPIAFDDLGRLNPVRDIFAYRVTNPATDSPGTPKRKVVVTTGLHSGEVLGTHTFEGLINWLVSDDIRASRLRDVAEVFAYPTLNAAGRFAGTSRATIENPDQDPNGLWSPANWATHQDIRASGEAMLADTQSTPGAIVDAFIDFHSTIPASAGDDFGFIEISEGDADAEWWQQLRSLQPNLQQIESTGNGRTTANFADDLLNAEVDVTLETEFGNNRPLSYYHDFGKNVGIAFFNAWVPQVVGDYDNNGIVDAADYTVWRDQLGAFVTLPNEDPAATPGQVTMEDYAVWKSHFGNVAASSLAISTATVPEPASLSLVFAGAFGLLVLRRCRTCPSPSTR